MNEPTETPFQTPTELIGKRCDCCHELWDSHDEQSFHECQGSLDSLSAADSHFRALSEDAEREYFGDDFNAYRAHRLGDG